MTRLIAASVSASALALALSSVAMAWSATCSTNQACDWKDASFGVPLAAIGVSVADYAGSYYPNTVDTLNDSVSSIKNTFSTYDVVWFFDANYSGTSFCLNSGWSSGQLNAHNDQYSSHLIAVGSTC